MLFIFCDQTGERRDIQAGRMATVSIRSVKDRGHSHDPNTAGRGGQGQAWG